MVYDESMLEHLGVRYVLTYSSSTPDRSADSVRVRRIDPRSRAPRRATDGSGKVVTARGAVGQEGRAAQ